MIYLMQLYKMVTDKKLFVKIFSDLDFELNDLGWKDAPNELIKDLLLNHFDLEIVNERQLDKITRAILNKNNISLLKNL